MILDEKLGQHMLFLDDVYVADGANPPVFRRVAGPKANDLGALAEQIAARVGQVLERRGLVERDIAGGPTPLTLDLMARLAALVPPPRRCRNERPPFDQE